MTEFKRSRLARKKEEQITKKTIFLGFLTVLIFILVIVFGLPFLINFSIFLGNSKSKKEVINENILPPLAPRLVVPFEATNSSKIIIDGFAESGSVVELLKNNESVGNIEVTDEGDFSFKGVELSEGENNFSAVTIKEDSGSSEESKELVVVFDNKSPELNMTNPSEDSLVVDSPDFDILGESEKGVSVLVNNRVAMVDSDGDFKIKIQLSAGKNDIEIVVKDAALNETKKKISITYDI
jgi:Glucodextranase, domain B